MDQRLVEETEKMRKFRVTVNVSEEYTVDVEAYDRFRADEIVSRMGVDGVRENGTRLWAEMDIPHMAKELE